MFTVCNFKRLKKHSLSPDVILFRIMSKTNFQFAGVGGGGKLAHRENDAFG